MKREIEFRGKSIDSNEWIYGFYAEVHETDVESNTIITCFHLGFPMPTNVHRDTVGQFTGRYDKNGEKIYEGDILRLKTGTNEMYDNCEVKYNCRMFEAYPAVGELEDFLDEALDYQDKCLTIVGNIHEQATK